MSSQSKSTDRATLAAVASQAMVERGLEPDFPRAAQQELAAIRGAAAASNDVSDLRDRVWASIDNDDSRDLDQLSVAEPLAGGRVRILVAVADVDALVRKGSALDTHPSCNTTSVYTPAAIFPMLPAVLSTDLTSLNEDQDRVAVVADMVFEADGSLAASELHRARVRNHGKAAMAGAPLPYTIPELADLAKHCTEREDAATKVERRVRKSAAALLLSGRIGGQFDAIVTGAGTKGTWVRIFQPPAEGRLEHGCKGLDVGDRLRVKLVHTDVKRGFIDFGRD